MIKVVAGASGLCIPLPLDLTAFEGLAREIWANTIVGRVV